MKKLFYLFITTLILSTSVDLYAQNPGGDSTDVYGCMDPEGLNYDSLATIDNGYCLYYCDSTSAYFWITSINDSIVNIANYAYSTAGITSYLWDFGDGSTSTIENPIHSYTNAGAYTICLTITAPGEDSSSECTNTFCDSLYVGDEGTIIIAEIVYGCTDPAALNYNPLATLNNGTCIYEDSIIYGCTDPMALNFNQLATVDDGSCFYESDTTLFDIYGCMDSMALNYNPFATIDDGSCYYDNDSTNVFGCTDTSALNYNPLATIDDGSCFYYCDSIIASFFVYEINEDDGILTIVNDSPFTPPGTTYYWDFGDSTYSTEAFPSHEYENTGLYSVCLTITSAAPTGGGICVNTFCLTVGIQLFGGQTTDGMTLNVISETATSISEEVENISDITLFPNPASNNLTIRFNLNSREEFIATIYDLSGRIVQSNTKIFSSGKNELYINLGDLHTGMYQIELRNNNSRNVMRFQVIK